MVKNATEHEMTFGERLTALREEQGLSLDELVFKSEVRYSALRRWEKGDSSPTLSDCLLRLANSLDVQVEYLLFGTGKKSPN